MSQILLKNGTGGAAHWTKGCSPWAERSGEGSSRPQRSFFPKFLESIPILHARMQHGLGGTEVSRSMHIFPLEAALSRSQRGSRNRTILNIHSFLFTCYLAIWTQWSPFLSSMLLAFLEAPSHQAVGRARLDGKATANGRELHPAWCGDCNGPKIPLLPSL